MRLVLPRAVAARTLLAAAALAALVTTVLLTAFLQYAYLLPQAGVRQAVVDTPAAERSVMLTSSAGSDAAELADRDAAVRDLFAGELAGLGLQVHTGGYGTSQRLPDDLPGVDPGPHGAYAVLAFLSGVDERAELVAGAWPEPVAADQPAQAAIPADVAATLGLSVGDALAIVDEIADEDRPVVVAGVWEPTDPTDPYWQLAAMPTDRGGWGPLVVHPDEFVARYQRLAILEWVADIDPAELARVGAASVAGALERLTAELAQHRTDPANPLDSSARLRTELAGLADRLATATVVNRSGLVLPAALLAVTAAYGLVLLARLLTAHRRGENALLRARGASRRRLVRLTATEAALVVTPAALLGAPLGTQLVRYADRYTGERSLGLVGDLAPYGWTGPPLAWVVAVVAAAGCAVTLALPAAGRGRTWVAEQQQRSRPSRAAAVQRAGLDVALVAVAVLAWTQLRQYGSAVAPRDVGGFGVDPLLAAAPVAMVLAATAVALRLLPLATRLGVRVAARRDTFPGLLGMWQADRRPHAGPVLLLVLAVATAVLAPTVAATWQQSQRDQAGHAVGADLRLVGAGPGAAAAARQLGERPDVTGLMATHRLTTRVPEGGRVPLLALDSEQARQVAQLREDLSGHAPEQLFGMLHEGRPEIGGLALPDGAQRLVGRFQFDAPEPKSVVKTFPGNVVGSFETFEIDVTPPATLTPTVHLADASGLISSQRLPDAVSAGEPLDIDVPLAPGTTTLVAFGAGLRLPPLEPALDPEDVGTAAVSWRWQELAVVDDAGRVIPLEVPDAWEIVHHPDQGSGPPAPHLAHDAPGSVSARFQPSDYPAQSVPFLLAEPFDVPQLPALFTPEVLAATGQDTGEAVDLDVGGVSVRVAGTLAAVPGVADGEGIVVDLVWLSQLRYREMREPPAVGEWWLATGAPEPVAAQAAQLGLRVESRLAEADRLLRDPLGSGMLLTLWTAAAVAALLAAFGLAVDARANAVGRRRELAVLHTLGASPAGLARALVVEQAVLAGLGVLAGVAVGVGVAAAMGTSLVLTPAGAVPVPPPLLALSPPLLAAPALGLFAAAAVLGALVARGARREVAAGALRIGED